MRPLCCHPPFLKAPNDAYLLTHSSESVHSTLLTGSEVGKGKQVHFENQNHKLCVAENCDHTKLHVTFKSKLHDLFEEGSKL